MVIFRLQRMLEMKERRRERPFHTPSALTSITDSNPTGNESMSLFSHATAHCLSNMFLGCDISLGYFILTTLRKFYASQLKWSSIS